jgi:hypothetical protein
MRSDFFGSRDLMNRLSSVEQWRADSRRQWLSSAASDHDDAVIMVHNLDTLESAGFVTGSKG